MKKIIIAAALIFTTGILSSCNSESNIKTTTVVVLRTFMSDKKDLASAN
jgi:hypothetical protein